MMHPRSQKASPLGAGKSKLKVFYVTCAVVSFFIIWSAVSRERGLLVARNSNVKSEDDGAEGEVTMETDFG